MTDQSGATINKEEKSWEKPWSFTDMKTNSTNWTLAADAGLLLHLKQFSENLISKSVEIEKKLQKLNHTEQQCLAKLNNVTSSFLLLENTQFIENRVYEHELADSQATTNKTESELKKEKTKEEKELELFNKMNEAVSIGMSIMDTYFEKLDPKQAKSKESDIDEDDEDEDNETDKNANNINSSDMFIYETKDPYVLRSLPYLIGSQAFLDNDHVGLKDLDSDDDLEEEQEEEEQDDDDDEPSETESKHSDYKTHQQVKKQVDSESSLSDDDDDDDLFKPKEDKKTKIFEDSESTSSDSEEEQVKPVRTTKQEDELFDANEQSDKEDEVASKPAAAAPSAPLDFAAELSARFASKNKPTSTATAAITTEKKQTEPSSSPKPAVKLVKKSNLFDSDEDNEDDDSSNQLFKSNKQTKNLFDDDDDNDDDEYQFKTKKEPIKTVQPPPLVESDQISTESKSTAMPKSELTSALNDLFAKKSKPKSFLNDDDDDPLFSSTNNKKTETKQEQPSLPPPSSAQAKKKVSLFDDDDDDDEEQEKDEKVEPVKSSTIQSKPPAKSIFDDDDDDEEDMFTKIPVKATPTKPVNPPITTISNTQQQPPKKTVSLFDSTDSSPESNLDEPKLKPTPPQSSSLLPKSTSTLSKPITKSTNLFETSEESSSPDLFTSTKLINKQETSDLFADEANDSMPELNAKKTPIESVKTDLKKPAKKSLFDSSTEDESDDLFKVTSKQSAPKLIEPVKQEIKKSVQTKSKSLFDSKSEEDDDDLFKLKSSKPEPVVKDPLFNDNQLSESQPPSQQQKQPSPPPARKLTNEDKPTPSKPIGAKNILFNLSALQNSNLFKKLAVQTKQSDSEESDTEISKPKTIEPVKVVVEQTPIKPDILNKNVDDFFTSNNESTTSKLKNQSEAPLVSSSNVQNENDLFSEIKADRAFSDNTMKNAQKDRIKAAAGKKRPPGNRKPNVQSESKPSIDLDDSFSQTTQTTTTITVTKETKSEPIKDDMVKKPAVSIFDDDSDYIFNKLDQSNKKLTEPSPKQISSLPVSLSFEQKSSVSRKSLENIFDDDNNNNNDDILKTKSITKTTKQLKNEIKIESSEKKPGASKFDSESDEFDLFASSSTISSSKNKKKIETNKKTLDNIFDDDTDIFSDVSTITSKKNLEEKANTSKKKDSSLLTTSKADTKKVSNKKDLFADISDDDDIFSSGVSKSRSGSGIKSTSNTTASKDEDLNSKKKDNIFDDPLNSF